MNSSELTALTKSKTAVIVGGGIIGTMHALLAVQAGYQVIHLERDPEPRSASVRNFGLIWVSGRAVGAELDLAIRARELWESIGSQAQIGFRNYPSLTIAQNETEFKIMNEAANMADADRRGFKTLTQKEIVAIEPALAGSFVGGLECTQDASVEPPLLLSGLRDLLSKSPEYTWIPNFEAVDFYSDETGNHITDVVGNKISGDVLALCPGAAHAGFLTEFFEGAPLRKVHLQMGRTVPFAKKLNHSIADADSMRYYPAFKGLSLRELAPQTPVAAEYKMQLLMVQRIDGTFTIGDTHSYGESFHHEIKEEPYEHLTGVISKILGVPAPLVVNRWDGVYSQSTSDDIYFRKEIAPGAFVVTGGGGRGNTLAPAIAEETINEWRKL